MSILHKGSL